MATEFTLFKYLPPEIRIRIWQESLQGRMVEVRWASEEGYSFYTFPPGTLSACVESREVTRPLYCATRIQRGNIATHFNFDIDVIYFPYLFPCAQSYSRAVGNFLNRLDPDQRPRHLALALPPSRDCPLDFFDTFQRVARKSCPLNLETLTLTLNDPVWNYDTGRNYGTVSRLTSQLTPSQISRHTWDTCSDCISTLIPCKVDHVSQSKEMLSKDGRIPEPEHPWQAAQWHERLYRYSWGGPNVEIIWKEVKGRSEKSFTQTWRNKFVCRRCSGH